MLRAVWLKTLRDQRWAVVGWGLGLGVLAIIVGIAWARAFPTEADRHAFALEATTGLSGVQILYGRAVRLDTLGGFVSWRSVGFSTVLLGLFMVIAVTGATRGAEASGRIEVVAARVSSRLRLLLETVAGIAVALALACVLFGACLALVGPVVGEPAIPAGDALLTALNCGLIAALFGAVALLSAQLAPARRTAGMIAGVLLIGTYIWHNLAIVVPALSGWRWLSPFALYARTTPAADGHTDGVALLGRAALALLFGAAGTVLATRRDLFDVWRPTRAEARAVALHAATPRRTGPPPRAWLLRNPFANGVRATLGTTVAWGIGLATFNAIMAAVIPSMRDALDQSGLSGQLLDLLKRAGVTSDQGMLGAFVFAFLPLLLALFALMLAASWSGEPRNGGLDLEVAAPVSRSRYAGQRLLAAVAALVAALAIAVVGLLAVGVPIDRGVDWARVILALVVLVPLPVVVLGFGYALAGWTSWPVAGVGGAVVVASFFLDLLVPLIGLPDWTRDASIFHLYGAPLLQGFQWPHLIALTLLAAAWCGLGVMGFRRQDLTG
jgi:ABC-2 type transport system permease protein